MNLKNVKTLKAFQYAGIGIILITIIYFSVSLFQKIEYGIITQNNISKIEGLVNETNFKLEFKSLKDLEYIVQDITIPVGEDYSRQTFKNNSKFNIYSNENKNIASIHYLSELNDINLSDKEYLKKIYNFVFLNISTFMYEKTLESIEEVQSDAYITTNKYSIESQGFTSKSIPIGETSEIKITTYYNINNGNISAYKINISILKGNKS